MVVVALCRAMLSTRAASAVNKIGATGAASLAGALRTNSSVVRIELSGSLHARIHACTLAAPARAECSDSYVRAWLCARSCVRAGIGVSDALACPLFERVLKANF